MITITLEAARVNVHLTQDEAAKKLGVSKRTLQNWEAGRTYPSGRYLDPICDLYRVPLNAINFLQ